MPSFPMITRMLTTFACACLLAMPALAELYKWTDAEGKVHYSDQPPPPNVKQPVTVKPRSQTAPTAAPDTTGTETPVATPKSNAEQDAEFNRRRVEAAEREAAAQKAAKEVANKKTNCEQAKAQLAGLQRGGRITTYDDKGETTYLGEAEIAQEIARAQQLADSWCK